MCTSKRHMYVLILKSMFCVYYSTQGRPSQTEEFLVVVQSLDLLHFHIHM